MKTRIIELSIKPEKIELVSQVNACKSKIDHIREETDDILFEYYKLAGKILRELANAKRVQ